MDAHVSEANAAVAVAAVAGRVAALTVEAGSKVPTFIESSFTSRVDYDAWVGRNAAAAKLLEGADYREHVTGATNTGRCVPVPDRECRVPVRPRGMAASFAVARCARTRAWRGGACGFLVGPLAVCLTCALEVSEQGQPGKQGVAWQQPLGRWLSVRL